MTHPVLFCFFVPSLVFHVFVPFAFPREVVLKINLAVFPFQRHYLLPKAETVQITKRGTSFPVMFAMVRCDEFTSGQAILLQHGCTKA